MVESAKSNGHNSWAYLHDVLARLDTRLNSRLEKVQTHRRQPATDG